MKHTTHISTILKTEINIASTEGKLKTSVETEAEILIRKFQAVSLIKKKKKNYKYTGMKSKVKVGVGPQTDARCLSARNHRGRFIEILKFKYEEVYSTPCNEKITLSPRDLFVQGTESH